MSSSSLRARGRGSARRSSADGRRPSPAARRFVAPCNICGEELAVPRVAAARAAWRAPEWRRATTLLGVAWALLAGCGDAGPGSRGPFSEDPGVVAPPGAALQPDSDGSSSGGAPPRADGEIEEAPSASMPTAGIPTTSAPSASGALPETPPGDGPPAHDTPAPSSNPSSEPEPESEPDPSDDGALPSPQDPAEPASPADGNQIEETPETASEGDPESTGEAPAPPEDADPWDRAMADEFSSCWIPALGTTYSPCFVNVYDALADTSLGLAAELDSGDGQHPNDAGHDVLFSAIAPVVTAYVCATTPCR